MKRWGVVILITLVSGISVFLIGQYIITIRIPAFKNLDLPNEEPAYAAADLELHEPAQEIVTLEPKVVVSGKTVTKKNVLVVTTSGEVYILKPEENGSFYVEAKAIPGLNRVYAFIFPPTYYSRSKSTLFYYLPQDTITQSKQVISGKIRHIGANQLILSTQAKEKIARLIEVAITPQTQIFALDKLAKRHLISFKDLKNEDQVTVIVDAFKNKNTTGYVLYATPAPIAFVSKIKAISPKLIIAQRFGWENDFTLEPLPELEIKRYRSKDAVIEQANLSDLALEQKVLVEGYEVPVQSDQIKVRQIIIIAD